MGGWTEDDVRRRNAEVFGVTPAELRKRDDDVTAACADVPEALIQEECTKLLEADGWRALRTDPVSDRGRGKGFGELGMADYLYIRYGRGEIGTPTDGSNDVVMWIEFKRSHGGVLNKNQQAWHTRERARGALTLIAGRDFPASVEGFKEWYKHSGLQRIAAL